MHESYSRVTAPIDMDESRGDEFNRSLLRAIHEASPYGILVVDEHAIVIAYNQRFLDVWQVPIERFLPNVGSEGVPDQPVLAACMEQVKDAAEVLKRIEDLYANPHADDQCEIALKDGRTLERHSKGLFSDSGAYMGRVWFFHDISDSKRTEAALRELAWLDSLTGLMNRRHFCKRADEEFMRARRYELTFSLLMLDLDYFKRINDRFGHAAGDTVLEVVSKRWCEQLREMDLLGRMGGEEFALLLPNTGEEGAQVVAERLRTCVSDAPIELRNDSVSCSVSIGVTTLRPDDQRIEDLLRRADKGLYEAKGQGRNCVSMAP